VAKGAAVLKNGGSEDAGHQCAAKLGCGLCAAFALALMSSAAIAGGPSNRLPGIYSNIENDPFWISEFRVGALAHQIEDSPGEAGVDLNLEMLFNPLQGNYSNRILQHFLTPRPHIGASINLNGDTSQFYFGTTWTIPLFDRVFFETSFGGSLNDGPHEGGHGESSFGCTLNFRESASLGYDISEHWDILLTIDHMSNAGICSENRGLTNAGVRLGYKW
jgi:hypothetical protein